MIVQRSPLPSLPTPPPFYDPRMSQHLIALCSLQATIQLQLLMNGGCGAPINHNSIAEQILKGAESVLCLSRSTPRQMMKMLLQCDGSEMDRKAAETWFNNIMILLFSM